MDGIGITDYLRARMKATTDYNDIGRTKRQRKMILAIFNELKSDDGLLWNVLNTAVTMNDGFFTDMSTADIVKLTMMLPNISWV